MLKYRGHVVDSAGVCQCGQTHDARRLTTDPTGTRGIRRAFMADLDIRWRAVRRMVRTVVVDQDLLGRRGGQIGADSALRVSAFSDWLTSMMQTTVLDTGIIRSYVERASALGVRTASVIVGSGGATRGRTELITGLAVNELRAIGSLVAQQSARAVAAGLLQGWTTARVVREVTTIIDKVAIARSRLVADHVVVRSYNDATLDVFEQAGHDMVDVLPELRPAVRVGDAKKKKSGKLRKTGKSRKTGPGSRVSRSRTPSASTIYRIARLEAETEAWAKRVNVETAEDDKVCTICLGIAEDGPYSINTARSLIPAHPRCRCAFVPVRRRRVKDGGFREEDHPRQPKGTEEGGQFAPASGGASGGSSAKSTRWYSDEEDEPEWQKQMDETNGEISKTELRSLLSYQNRGYRRINSSLRKDGPLTPTVKNIDSVMSRSSLKKDTTLYRGIDSETRDNIIKSWESGSRDIVIHDKGYVSTSLDKETPWEHSPDIVTISAPKGTRAIAMTNVNADESEILLDRGTGYKVTDVTKGRAGWKIQAELVKKQQKDSSMILDASADNSDDENSNSDHFVWSRSDIELRIGTKDAFNEADHPRDPKGTTTGGQFASKNAVAAPSKPKGPSTDTLLAKENEGKASERVAMRKALKAETDPMKKDALRKKIMESFKLEYDKTGYPALLGKMDKYSKIYGLPNPMSGTSKAPTISEIKKTPGVVIPEKSPYSPEEVRTFALLNKFDSSSAKTWMLYAKEKKAAGDKLGLTFEELAYAQTYTGHGYRQVNSQLRHGTIDEPTYEYATRFDRVLDKLPVHQATTYRGTDLTLDQAAKYQPGKVVVEAAFTSSSKDSSFQNKGGYGFVIRGKTGRDISSVSKYPHEQEILFKKNTAFKVTKVEPKYNGGKTIYMEEVDF